MGGTALRMARASETVRLLEADPDLGALLTGPRRDEAERDLTVRRHDVPAGTWDVERLERRLARPRRAAAARRRPLARAGGRRPGERRAARPRRPRAPVADRQPRQPAARRGRVVGPDRRSTWRSWTAASPPTSRATRRSPPCCFDRLGERSVRLGTTQAISQLTRVDRRLRALFWHLAERWGRVSSQGVIVPLALTHRILGQLVGARRPTVSTALAELAEREELVRRPDGSWLLRGDPPNAQTLARRPAVHEEPERPHAALRPRGRRMGATWPRGTRITGPPPWVGPGTPGPQARRLPNASSFKLRGHPLRRPRASSARSSSRCSRRPTGWSSRP